MSDIITLIEKIQQNQAELSSNLELLKETENSEYSQAIQSIQDQQAQVALEVNELEQRVREDKGGNE